MMQGQFPEAEEHLVEAEHLANQCGDLPGLAELHMTYCYLRVPFGQFDDAVDHLEEVAKIGQNLDLEEPKLFGMTHIANTLTFLTRFDEAWQQSEEALQAAEELGNLKYQAEILTTPVAFYHMRNGDLNAARHAAEQGMNIASQIGAADSESAGSFVLGLIAWLEGEYQTALESQQRALQAGRSSGMPFLEAAALCALGTVYLDISAEFASKTMEYHKQALEMMEMPLGTTLGAMSWAEVGFCALAAGDVKDSSELFEKGLTISTSLKYLARPQLLVGSAFVALAKGDSDEAAKLVDEARQFAEERAMQNFYAFVAFAGGQEVSSKSV